jgi:arylsulfatase
MSRPFRGVINVDITDSVPDWEPYTQPISAGGTPGSAAARDTCRS